MIIRREQPPDRSAIGALHTAAFPAKPGEPSPEARLVDRLRAAGDAVPALSLVATYAEEVVGHVVCSRGSLDGRALLGLGPLGVLPSHQRRGVGQALMHAVLGAADALDEPGVVLLGDPAYYGRFGFVPAASVGVLSPVAGWAEHFQLRRLTSWDDSLRGVFRYADAFSAL